MLTGTDWNFSPQQNGILGSAFTKLPWNIYKTPNEMPSAQILQSIVVAYRRPNSSL